jgi:hypothetical protein
MTGSVSKAGTAPAVQSITGEFTDAQGQAVDFDGNYTLAWQAVSNAQKYEIEHSTDGTSYQVITQVGGDATSYGFAGQPNGSHSYRVRALVPGQIGYYVTPASNAQSILVDLRGKVNITQQVERAVRDGSISFTGGVFKLDLNFKNISSTNYVPLVEANVVRIASTSGTVSVKNAENGGDGKSATTAALFSYSNLLGADQEFAANEITGNRTLQFNDTAAELFSFDVSVTAFERGASSSNSSSATGGGGSAGGTGGSTGSGTSVQSLTRVMRITVNPLTRAVSAKLL